MTVFLVIGAVGVVLLLVSLIVGDVIHGALEVGGDFVSGPALAAFVGAFGFGGALALYAGAPTPVAVLAGLLLGALLGAAAGWAAAQLSRGGDTANVRTGDLVGRPATVVTEIPEGGYGTVSIVASGHITSLNARCKRGLDPGTAVRITAVLSPTSVAVEPAPRALPPDER